MIKYIVIAVIVILFVLILIDNKNITTTALSVSSPKIPESFKGFRIVHISDLHNDTFGKDNKKLISKIKAAKPDIIVITGDLIDSRRTNYSVALSFAEKAAKIAPTYYTIGNHEARKEDLAGYLSKIAERGVTVLSNEKIYLEKNGERLALLGIPSPFPESSLNEKELKALVDTKDYEILLSHHPEFFENYVSCGVDLVFSGHAHGGQFRLPVLGGLYAPGQGVLPKYTSGIYSESNTNMVVSRGIGNSLFPLRFNDPPEIITLTLK